MGDNAAFYQTFFQYDTLFKVFEETHVKENLVEKLDEEAVAVITKSVPSETPAPVTAPPLVVSVHQAPAPFPALQHQILVMVDEPRQPELPQSQALLLENILKATGNAASKIDLLNFSYIPQADARAVLTQKSTSYFISFGVPLIKLQLDILLPPYTPTQIEGIWFLLTDPLAVIEADRSQKKRLWLALQTMFGLA